METRRISRRKPSRQLARGRSCETSRPCTLVHRVHLPSSLCCTTSCSSLSLSPTCRCSSGLRRDGDWHSTIKHWLLQRGVRVALRLHLQQRHIRRPKRAKEQDSRRVLTRARMAVRGREILIKFQTPLLQIFTKTFCSSKASKAKANPTL
jgi:hypothetical protein